MIATYHVIANVNGQTFTNLVIQLGPRTTFDDMRVVIARYMGLGERPELVTVHAAQLIG